MEVGVKIMFCMLLYYIFGIGGYVSGKEIEIMEEFGSFCDVCIVF